MTSAKARKVGKTRCGWCGDDALYVDYHDTEWGVPVTDRQALFERLALESMQAGLAWITVLKKREHMRAAFFDFDIERLARANRASVARWLEDPGIIRHRGKLEAMIGNAKLAVKDPDFGAMLWSFAPAAGDVTAPRRLQEVPSVTPESTAMSSALKKSGYRFVGPTICYAFMQSVGMVNDHVADCFRRDDCTKAGVRARRSGVR